AASELLSPCGVVFLRPRSQPAARARARPLVPRRRDRLRVWRPASGGPLLSLLCVRSLHGVRIYPRHAEPVPLWYTAAGKSVADRRDGPPPGGRPCVRALASTRRP